MGATATSTKPSFAEALALWGKLGVLSFGGPAGQIAVLDCAPLGCARP